MSDLSDKVALITGAGSGIGAALALEAARRGMHLVACDYRADTVARTVEMARAAGSAASVHSRVFDVRDVAAFDRVSAELKTMFGGVDLLCCNAGVLTPGRVWEMAAADFDALLDINVKGVVNAIRAFLPDMLARGAASNVLITGSMGGLIPSPMLSAYSASKAAVIAIAETLHLDLAAIGAPIRVSLLAPGAVKTGIFDTEPSDVTSKHLMAAMRAGSERVGMAPSDVALISFQAIEAGKFWVFPHPDMLPAVPERIAKIVAGDAPTFDFQRSFRQPAAR